MNTVEPIRDMNLIWDIGDYLQARSERDYVLFMFGIYSGLRISDMLGLRVRDVRNKDYIYLREMKTNKEKRFPINKDLKAILSGYLVGKKDYEFLFKSRNGYNKPISRERAYQILDDAARQFHLENIGCHTLRKTFGYWLYQTTKDAVGIKEILNHSDISVTLRYIGVNQDSQDKLMRGLSYQKR